MEQITPLLPVLELKEHFQCKLTLKCPFPSIIKCIVDALKGNPEDLEWFQKESPFGHFLDIPNHYEHSSQMMWMLLLRQANVDRKYEMWFIVNGKPIRFSSMEYCLISGLKCTPYPEGFMAQAESKRFIKKHFPKKVETGITIDDLMKKLKEMGDETESRKRKKKTGKDSEKLKMAMLLFVSTVLFHGDRPSSKIDEKLVGMADNMDLFVQYPWGRHSFIHLLRQIQKPLKEKAQTLLKGGCTESSLTYQGFVYPLAVSKIFQDNIMFIYNKFYV